MVIECTSSHSFEPSLPQAKIENDAGASVSQSASAELILSGCWAYISLPCQSPVTATSTNAASDTNPPSRTERRQTAESTSAADCPASARRRRCHRPTPTSRAPATMSEATIVWVNAASAVLLVRTATKSTCSGRPVASSTTTPTGCCIQELAAMMKYALTIEPTTAAHRLARGSFFGVPPQPKIHRPRKVDSRKKASSASRASSEPKTSPTKREYSLQARPNWNSWTSPVATPSTKLIR